jgi:hypothetical protein
MKRRFAMLGLVLVAAGCASVPKAPAEHDALAKEFRPTPGKANVYVFRDELIGAAVKMTVALDGVLLGDTAAKTFLVATVAPGPHALVSKAENDARLDFTAEPGKNVYVWQEVKMGFMWARTRLELVDEAAAKPRILECSLAESALAPAPAAAPAAPAVPGA